MPSRRSQLRARAPAKVSRMATARGRSHRLWHWVSGKGSAYNLLQLVTRSLNGSYAGMVLLGLQIDGADTQEQTMATPTGMHHYRLALAPVVASAAPGGQPAGLEQRLAQASARRVGGKEVVFAEGDPITPIFQVEGGGGGLFRVVPGGGGRG